MLRTRLRTRLRVGGDSSIHDGFLDDFVNQNFYARPAGGDLTRYANAQSAYSWSSSPKSTKNAGGVLVASDANAPGYEWDKNRNPIGPRVESSFTSIARNSGTPATSAQYSAAGVTKSAVSGAPLSGESWCRLTEDTSTGLHRLVQVDRPTAAASQYVGSWFVRPGARNRIALSDNAGGSGSATFLLTGNGSVTATSGGATGLVELWDSANGVYRIALMDAAAAVVWGTTALLADGTGATNYTGDGTSFLDLWGCNLGLGSWISTYVPSTTSDVVRNADTVTKTIPSISSGYTLFAQWSNAKNTGGHVVNISGATLVRQSGGTLRLNANGVEATGGAASSGKAAISVSGSSVLFSFNGATLSGTGVYASTPVSAFRLGSDGSANHLDGNIARVEMWLNEFSQAQLNALTA